MSAVWVKMCTIVCFCYTAETKEVVWKEVGESMTFQCRSKPGRSVLHFKTGLREETAIAKVEKATRKKTGFEVKIDRFQINGTFPNVSFSLRNLTVNDTGPYWCLYLNKDLQMMTQNIKGEGTVLLVVKESCQKGASGTQMQNQIHTQTETQMQTQMETQMQTQMETQMQTQMETQMQNQIQTGRQDQLENSHARAEAVRDHGGPHLKNMPVVYAVPGAALLLGIILGCIIWIKRKTKSSDITVEQTCVATSAYVYKDKEHVETVAEVEDENEDEAVSVQHANPTETPDTLDHSLKSDA